MLETKRAVGKDGRRPVLPSHSVLSARRNYAGAGAGDRQGVCRRASGRLRGGDRRPCGQGAYPRPHPFSTPSTHDTGEKYHSNAQSYYRQIRAISDRLCREHGLSVILQGQGRPRRSATSSGCARVQGPAHLPLHAGGGSCGRPSRTPTTWATSSCIMEHKGYEISHGNRLGLPPAGTGAVHGTRQEKSAVHRGRHPCRHRRGTWMRSTAGTTAGYPATGRSTSHYRRHPKYTGFMALYVHYLYLLGKVGQRQYPPQHDAPPAAGTDEVRAVPGAVRLPAGATASPRRTDLAGRPYPHRGNAGQPDQAAHHPQCAEEEAEDSFTTPFRGCGGPRPGEGTL